MRRWETAGPSGQRRRHRAQPATAGAVEVLGGMRGRRDAAAREARAPEPVSTTRLWAQRRRSTARFGAVAAAAWLALGAGCAGGRKQAQILDDELLSQPISILRTCAGVPSVEIDGEKELQTYVWEFELSGPLAPGGYNGPRGLPTTSRPGRRDESGRAKCTLELEVAEGRIQSTKLDGTAVLAGDSTYPCARRLRRCLDAR